MTAHRQSLYFTAPHTVEVRSEQIPAPQDDEVLVQTRISAISPGTEMLFYRGQIPEGMAADSTIAALSGGVAYPFKYGYACVGEVIETGAHVDPSWRGRRVFAFHPHESHFCARPHTLIPVPADLPTHAAALLPNVETAVNFLLDGRPLVGESVVVFGLGVVGLLTTAVVARFPLATLVAVDPLAARRDLATSLGATAVLDPTATSFLSDVETILGDAGADLVYELSGNPAALDQAIAVTGYSGRIIVGSWYGDKRTALNLGGDFHRSRIQIQSSQVSTVTPSLAGRWDKARRLNVAWSMLGTLPMDKLITHRTPFAAAADAYALIATQPEACVQVLLEF
ncbi:zinc-binding dehydrogenase [bacterium]|nr:zinc-binding dehydrogenase [bacterium]